MSLSLPPEISQRELELRRVASDLKKTGQFAAAEGKYLEAWHVLPEPRHLWDTSQSVLRSIVRFYFESSIYAQAELWAKELFNCDPLLNDTGAYILLGKIYMEWGKDDLARENLVKAYEMGGRRGFVGEDPKYLKFAQTQMKK